MQKLTITVYTSKLRAKYIAMLVNRYIWTKRDKVTYTQEKVTQQKEAKQVK